VVSNALGAIYTSAVEWPGAPLPGVRARLLVQKAGHVLARRALEAAIGNEPDLLALIEPPENSWNNTQILCLPSGNPMSIGASYLTQLSETLSLTNNPEQFSPPQIYEAL